MVIHFTIYFYFVIVLHIQIGYRRNKEEKK